MRKFLKSAIEYLAKDLDLDKELLEQIQYVVIVLTFEFIKCISVILIAGILGYFKESLIVILSMCFIKPFIGGYHEDSQLKCFIATLIITTSIIMLVTFNKLNLFSIVILNLFSIFSIYNKAPVIKCYKLKYSFFNNLNIFQNFMDFSNNNVDFINTNITII